MPSTSKDTVSANFIPECPDYRKLLTKINDCAKTRKRFPTIHTLQSTTSFAHSLKTENRYRLAHYNIVYCWRLGIPLFNGGPSILPATTSSFSQVGVILLAKLWGRWLWVCEAGMGRDKLGNSIYFSRSGIRICSFLSLDGRETAVWNLMKAIMSYINQMPLRER